jgi:hypothetical protein
MTIGTRGYGTLGGIGQVIVPGVGHAAAVRSHGHDAQRGHVHRSRERTT